MIFGSETKDLYIASIILDGVCIFKPCCSLHNRLVTVFNRSKVMKIHACIANRVTKMIYIIIIL